MKNGERKVIVWRDDALRAVEVREEQGEVRETRGFAHRLGGVLLFAGLTIGLTLLLWAVVVAGMLALAG